MRTSDLDTPSLLVNLDVLARNVERMAQVVRSRGLALRPHVKTHKTAEIARMQLEAGARGLTVATVSEAEAMAAAGAHDILIGNQVIGANLVQRVVDLARKVSLAVVVDSAGVAQPLAEAAAAAGTVLPVLLEVDTGCHRCGVPPEQALALAEQVAAMPGVAVVGLFDYPGHARKAGSGDGVREVAAQEAAALTRLADEIAPIAAVKQWLSGGSTLTAPVYEPGCGLTEVRPGTYVYNDLRMVDLGCAKIEDCAQTVLASVISARGEHVVVNAGSKCLTTDAPYRTAGLGLIKGMTGAYVEMLYEEHGCLRVPAAAGRLEVGDRVEIIPSHACVVSNLFSEAVVVGDGTVEDRWRILGRR